MKYEILQIILLLLLAVSPALLYANQRANFLSHGPSVAAYGRGETSCSGSGEIALAFFNPSYLALAGPANIAFTHYALYEGSMYDFAGAGFAPLGRFSFGLSAINLRSGEIEVRQGINDTPGRTFANHLAVTGSLAARFSEFHNLRAGVNIKYAQLNLYNASGGSAAADIGLSKDFAGPRIFGRESTIYSGLAVQNIIQPKFTLVSDEESYARIYLAETCLSMPLTFIYDTATKNLYYDNFKVCFSASREENKNTLRAGVEYAAKNALFLRAGFYDRHCTAGFGYQRGQWRFDYAADLADFAVFHRVGVNYSFNTAKDADSRREKPAKMDGRAQNELLREALLKQEEYRQESLALDRKHAAAMDAAEKEYAAARYLKAAEIIDGILLSDPGYGPALNLNKFILSRMSETAFNDGGGDPEKAFYAKGYISYTEGKYEDALNQWEKLKELNPAKPEIAEYSQKVRMKLEDAAAVVNEREAEEKAVKLFGEGVRHYENGKWVQCIRKMEKIKEVVEQAKARNSAEWALRADGYLKNSVDKLSQTVVRSSDETGEDEREKELDARTAEKKYTQGLLLYAQGKLSSSARMWEIALRFNPEHEKAKLALEKVNQELREGKTVK